MRNGSLILLLKLEIGGKKREIVIREKSILSNGVVRRVIEKKELLEL